MDQFTEVTHTGWFGRIGNSIMGALIGLVLFVVAFPLLFWNEGRAVQTAKSLDEGAGVVVTVSADDIDPANDGKLVHLTGTATTEQTLNDPAFGVTAEALRLRRDVEMYQWTEREHTEREKQLGGGEKKVTTYTYDTEWVDHEVSSSSFRHPQGHDNPPMPYSSRTVNADDVQLGSFRLTDSQVGRVDRFEQIRVEAATLPDELKTKAKPYSGGYYIGGAPESPAVGDTRIFFQIVKPTQVSVIAKQVGESFTAYQTKAGDALDMLELGALDAETMFKQAHDRNKMLTWILRAVGGGLMFFGLCLVMGPMSTFFDLIPFVGNIVGGVTAIAAAIIAVSLSSITIGFAWVFYRPLIGVPLLVAGVAIIVLFGMNKKPAAEA